MRVLENKPRYFENLMLDFVRMIPEVIRVAAGVGRLDEGQACGCLDG